MQSPPVLARSTPHFAGGDRAPAVGGPPRTTASAVGHTARRRLNIAPSHPVTRAIRNQSKGGGPDGPRSWSAEVRVTPISARAPQQNFELVFAFHQAYNRGDLDQAFACFHDEIEVCGYNGFVARGREASRRSALAWLEQWTSFTSEPKEVSELDERRVLVICHNYGTGRLSGVEIDMSAGEIWGFLEGKIRSVTVFRDCREARKRRGSGSASPEALGDPDRLCAVAAEPRSTDTSVSPAAGAERNTRNTWERWTPTRFFVETAGNQPPISRPLPSAPGRWAMRDVRRHSLDPQLRPRGGGRHGRHRLHLSGEQRRGSRDHASRADLPVDEVIRVADTVIVRPDPAASTA